jgi:hypothetical protein
VLYIGVGAGYIGVMVDVDLRRRKCAFIRPGFFRIIVQPFTLRGTFSRSCLKRSCEMFGVCLCPEVPDSFVSVLDTSLTCLAALSLQ